MKKPFLVSVAAGFFVLGFLMLFLFLPLGAIFIAIGAVLLYFRNQNNPETTTESSKPIQKNSQDSSPAAVVSATHSFTKPVCSKTEAAAGGNEMLEETLRIISTANSSADALSPKITHSKIKATPKKIFTTKDLEAIKEYVVLDTETTGFSRNDDRIVEIAVVHYKDGKEINRFRSLINPQIPISPAASAVNHITNEDVASAPTIEAVLSDVLRVIDRNLVVGHNVSFDLGFLGCAIPQEHEDLEIEYIDTASLSKRAFPGLGSYKLVDLVAKLKISDSQTHRALGDVELTAKLFEACRTAIADAYKKELAERKMERERKKAEKALAFKWSPLLEKNFVFTGDFENDRDQLQEELEKVGANLRPQVNRNTDYLVAGELANLPQWALERKYLKAKEFLDKGGKLQIITEKEFLLLMQNALSNKPDK